MSRGVDVLAVMDLASRHLNGGADSLTAKEHFEAFEGMKEARAAVAELIESVEQKLADAEQGYFEEWLESESPSGDHEEVQRKWLNSYPYKEFILEWGEQVSALARVRGAG